MSNATHPSWDWRSELTAYTRRNGLPSPPLEPITLEESLARLPPPLPYLPPRAAGTAGPTTVHDNLPDRASASRDEAKSPIPRNLLFPRRHQGLSRIEEVAPGHEVRLGRHALGAHSQFGAIVSATGIGTSETWLRDVVRKWMKSETWRTGFEAAFGQEAYQAYMKEVAEPSWWGDKHSLRALRRDMCWPMVIASRDAEGRLHVEWANEVDQQKFERGELDKEVVGIWREGSVHEVMY